MFSTQTRPNVAMIVLCAVSGAINGLESMPEWWGIVQSAINGLIVGLAYAVGRLATWIEDGAQ